MVATEVLYGPNGKEELHFHITDALEAQYEGQQHYWVEHHVDGGKINTHFWPKSEAEARALMDAQVAGAKKMGWGVLKKRTQMDLF